MKCRSCGKRFDYEKYYGICPKCGVYHKPEEKADEQPEVTYEQSGMFDGQSTQEQDGMSQSSYHENRGNDDTEPYEYESWRQVYDQPESKIKSFRSTAVLGIIVLVAFVVTFGIGAVGSVLMKHVRETARIEAESRVWNKIEPEELSLGDTLEKVPLEVEKVELIAQADQVEGFPPDEILVGVRVVVDARYIMFGQDSYYTLDPVDFYVQYDGRYRSPVDSYYFDPEYMHILDGRKDFSGYGSYDAGYIYFFIPQDAQECAIYVQTWDETKENIQSCYRIPFTVNMEEDGGVGDE